jgi:hypothetical protein
VALAILAGLGAYAYFVESKRTPSTKEGDQKTAERVFPGIARDKIKEILLAPAQGETIRLVKSNEAWTMTEPQAVAAASNEVDSLISAIETIEISNVVDESGTDLGEYGLSTPALTLGVLVEGATEPTKLAIGDDVPVQGQSFAKIVTQARVITIPSHIKSTFNKKPFDLRDRDLLHLKRDDVKTLAIDGPEGRYALERQGEDEWRFQAPLKTRAGRWSVDSLIGALEYLRMDAIAAESAQNLKPFGLDRPARSVAIGLGAGKSKKLEIGQKTKDDKYYARDASARLIGVIPRTIVDDLAKGMGELRAKRLLEISAYDVVGFDFERDGKKRVYARSTSKDKDGVETQKWKRTAPDAKDLETNAVQDALFKIGGVDVQAFIDKPAAPAEYGLDKPALKVVLRSAAPRPTVWFEIGKKGDDVFARRPDDDAILKLDKAKAQELVDGFKDF